MPGSALRQDQAGRSRMGGVENIKEAVRLTWRAAPRLLVVTAIVPAALALLAAVQLVLVRRFTAVLLEHAGANDPGDAVRQLALPAALVVGSLAVMVVLTDVERLLQELLTERVRVASARRTHQAIGRLDLIDFEYPEIHDRIYRAAGSDYRPAQIVRSLTSIFAIALRTVALVVMIIAIAPLLLPFLIALSLPVLIVAKLMAGQRFRFMFQMTPLERRRLYFSRMLIAREPAAENRAFGLAPHFGEQFDRLSQERDRELASTLRRQWHSMVIGQVAFVLLSGATLLTLGWLFSSGRADAASLLTAGFGVAQIAGQIGGLGVSMTDLAESSMFLRDQRDFLELLEHTAKTRPSGPEGGRLETLRVQEASFTYPSRQEPALSNVSMTIESGEIVALVGINGSGKTTFGKLIGLLYRPTSGSITWNGVDSGALDIEATRRRITTVFQDFQTYSETIRDSVAFGDMEGDPDDDRVAESLRAAGFDDGELDLNLFIGPEVDGGTSLSVGQRQRLAIARALYRRADLLILDEPTSSVDARTEHDLLRSLRVRGQTTVLISHRLANVSRADAIYVFDAGRIVESGDHETLMAKGGIYRDLYLLQASLYDDQSIAALSSFDPAVGAGDGDRGRS